MTRRLKRLREFDIVLQIKNEDFINPPRMAQRNWLLNKALTEFASDLKHLDHCAKRFVPGQEIERVSDRGQARLSEEEIMEDWQIPLMTAMADIVTEFHGDILEIGFGRGVSAELIQTRGVSSHTIVECSDAIIADIFQPWRARYPDRDIRLVHGLWQDTIEQLKTYDGIFFHTYPLNEAEYLRLAVNSATFAEHFFSTAAQHLRDGGIFTYLTHEIDTLSRGHQRAVFQYFKEFTLRRVALSLPQDVKDAWWADSMIVIKAVK